MHVCVYISVLHSGKIMNMNILRIGTHIVHTQLSRFDYNIPGCRLFQGLEWIVAQTKTI